MYSQYSNLSALLQLGVEGSSGGAIFPGTSAYASVIGTTSPRSFQIATNNAVAMTIASSGNVGIGTSSPSAVSGLGLNKFIDISGATIPGIVFHSSSGTQECAIGTGSEGLSFGAYGSATASKNIINFFTSDTNSSNSITERMRISSNGNILIGTTTANGRKLYIEGFTQSYYAINKAYFTPLTGANIGITSGVYNIINPAGAIASLNLYFPTPTDGDILYLKFTQAVTSVTYNSGTIKNQLSPVTAGQLIMLVYDSATATWY
jgi:hypothetical protein